VNDTHPPVRSITPALSLILCSRNDEYMGNSRWRLETTLNYVGDRVEALGRADDVEVLVTDWGSDVPLRDVVKLGPAAARIVSFVTVPAPLVRERQHDSPFSDALALNVAARRARGRYFGRIDQDTLVGERFLRWFFQTVEGERRLASGVQPEKALFFSNRRDIPYRLAVRSPGLRGITTFIRLFGGRLSVLREPHAAGDLYWTGAVGIWLTHRDCWTECSGYDERLIYYNWTETDMICRLRPPHILVDLGELTGWDFYHLEHYDPRASYLRRAPRVKNTAIDLAAPPSVVHPNSSTWGLQGHDFPVERAAASASGDGQELFPLLLAAVAGDLLVDRIVIAWKMREYVWGGRYRRVRETLSSQPPWRWPAVLWNLWGGRSEARIRRMSGAHWLGVRRALVAVARSLGLLGSVRRLRARVGAVLSPAVRREAREDCARFARFDREYGAFIGYGLAATGASKTALAVSSRCPTIEGELCTIKALQLAGFKPVVLLEDERSGLRPFYERTGVRDVHFWSDFATSSDYSTTAAALVGQCRTVDELMTRTHAGVRVGMIAVCTALRRLRLGVLTLERPAVRALLTRSVAASMAAAEEARRMLEVVSPDLVLSDQEYTPKGEFFETCLNSGRNVIGCTTAHRSDALVFKRYGLENRDDHLTTLSSSSWALARDLEWTNARRDRLSDEVTSSYVMGDWYHTPWLHSRGHPMEPDELRTCLGIDATRKTAFIFPHVLWDAPVMWGQPLFPNYQEWFVETVGAACRNTHVNWVIKVHPDHVWKHEENGHRGEAAEIRVLREQLGTLPSHITLIPPDTRISTLSLFSIMDYCLTVRGTVGVEAARLGIPVLTAGPARYSERGFTIDSASRAEYLARLARIQHMSPLADEQRELAERFAYGLLLLRPLKLTSIAWDPSGKPGVGSTAHRRARLTVRTEDDWRHAADLSALADWLVSRDEDFLTHAE